MELEKQRGISISSTVLQFDYGGFAVNLLCVHQSHGQGLRGLPEVTGPDEHPYRRDCAARLSNGAIPVLRG